MFGNYVMQFAITHVRVEAKLMAESGEKIIFGYERSFRNP